MFRHEGCGARGTGTGRPPRSEQPVRAEVTRPVVVHGVTAIPAGSTAFGHVVAVRPAGHLKQRSLVTVRFTELQPRGEGERFRIQTRSWSAVGPSLTNRTVGGIGVPAAGGAIIGALVGGGKGAGIGAAVGAGAGTARLMVTRGKNVRVGRGALLSVRLTSELLFCGAVHLDEAPLGIERVVAVRDRPDAGLRVLVNRSTASLRCLLTGDGPLGQPRLGQAARPRGSPAEM